MFRWEASIARPLILNNLLSLETKEFKIKNTKPIFQKAFYKLCLYKFKIMQEEKIKKKAKFEVVSCQRPIKNTFICYTKLIVLASHQYTDKRFLAFRNMVRQLTLHD